MKHIITFSRKLLLFAAIVALATSSLRAATIYFEDGNVNAEFPTGPLWVNGTGMFQSLVYDNPIATRASGAEASSQEGFNLFSPLGGGLDVTLLAWEFFGLSLMGIGDGDSLTQSPGIDSKGYEDYRYDDEGGDGVPNLYFYYNGDLWAMGFLTRFVVEVENEDSEDGIAWGTAYIHEVLPAGQDFYDEIMALSYNTGQLEFSVDSFTVYAWEGLFASFSSSGSFTVVPESSTVAAVAGIVALTLVSLRRKRRAG